MAATSSPSFYRDMSRERSTTAFQRDGLQSHHKSQSPLDTLVRQTSLRAKGIFSSKSRQEQEPQRTPSLSRPARPPNLSLQQSNYDPSPERTSSQRRQGRSDRSQVDTSPASPDRQTRLRRPPSSPLLHSTFRNSNATSYGRESNASAYDNDHSLVSQYEPYALAAHIEGDEDDTRVHNQHWDSGSEFDSPVSPLTRGLPPSFRFSGPVDNPDSQSRHSLAYTDRSSVLPSPTRAGLRGPSSSPNDYNSPSPISPEFRYERFASPANVAQNTLSPRDTPLVTPSDDTLSVPGRRPRETWESNASGVTTDPFAFRSYESANIVTPDIVVTSPATSRHPSTLYDAGAVPLPPRSSLEHRTPSQYVVSGPRHNFSRPIRASESAPATSAGDAVDDARGRSPRAGPPPKPFQNKAIAALSSSDKSKERPESTDSIDSFYGYGKQFPAPPSVHPSPSAPSVLVTNHDAGDPKRRSPLAQMTRSVSPSPLESDFSHHDHSAETDAAYVLEEEEEEEEEEEGSSMLDDYYSSPEPQYHDPSSVLSFAPPAPAPQHHEPFSEPPRSAPSPLFAPNPSPSPSNTTYRSIPPLVNHNGTAPTTRPGIPVSPLDTSVNPQQQSPSPSPSSSTGSRFSPQSRPLPSRYNGLSSYNNLAPPSHSQSPGPSSPTPSRQSPSPSASSGRPPPTNNPDKNAQRNSLYSNYSFYALPESPNTSNPNSRNPSPAPRSTPRVGFVENERDIVGNRPKKSSNGPSGLSPHPDRPNLPQSRSVHSPAALRLSPGKFNNMPQASTPEEYLQLGIQAHEADQLPISAYCFEKSAKEGGGCGIGMLMWGLTLRHGWGVTQDEKRGFTWVRRAAEAAVEDLEKTMEGDEQGAVRNELVLAIFEVGQCYAHGWGVKEDKKMAVSYFQVAARLGDPDAQQELAFCFLNGKGCKKDKKAAAKWYRAAAAQGVSTVGLAWIYKDKYNE